MPPKVDKIEAEIRKLAKLDGNKTCADCPEKVPGYVDLTHNVFVCTKCSGIHREFQFKIKGVSMAVFTAEDVAGLSSMGNETFNSIYLSRLNPRDYILPNGNDVNKLKEFIKQKYVDKRWHRDSGTASSLQSAPPVSSAPSTIHDRPKFTEWPVEPVASSSPAHTAESIPTNKISIKLNRPAGQGSIVNRRGSTGTIDSRQKKSQDITSGMDLLSVSGNADPFSSSGNADPFSSSVLPTQATSSISSDPFASPSKTHDKFDPFGETYTTTNTNSSTVFDPFGDAPVTNPPPARQNGFEEFGNVPLHHDTQFATFSNNAAASQSFNAGFDEFNNTPAKTVPFQTIKPNPPAPVIAPTSSAPASTAAVKDFGAFDDLVSNSLSTVNSSPATNVSANPFDSMHSHFGAGPSTTAPHYGGYVAGTPPTYAQQGGFPQQVGGYPHQQAMPAGYGYGYAPNPYAPGYNYPAPPAPTATYYGYPPQQSMPPFQSMPSQYPQTQVPPQPPAASAPPANDPFAAMSSMAWTAAGGVAITNTANHFSSHPQNSAYPQANSHASPSATPNATGNSVNPFDLF